ncbi:MAG TPA: methyltransferase domain-containing protein [Pyrinomonadaceae bacterium]|nr:methyltransferase domain-containing protein [Pyrinomonadaceae bacterium]
MSTEVAGARRGEDFMARRKAAARGLDPVSLPDYALFAASCRRGLSVVYPFNSDAYADEEGWKYGARWPPSHKAFGRMRGLLAAQDSARLGPRRVLEVAAGGGGLAALLALGGCEVVVNDLRAEHLADAVREFEGGERVRLVGGNLFDLSPQSLGRFDLVIACEVIEHVAHPGDLLAHLKRFLAPGGRLLLTTPNGSYFRNRLPTYSEVDDPARLEAVQFRPDADGHLFLLTPRELAGLAEAAGLSVERLSAWGTPVLSGHAGLRFLSGPRLTRVAYEAERLAQRLPPAARVRACAQLSAVLRRPASDGG